MAKTTSTANKNQSIGPQTPELFVTSTMRRWSGEAIDRFVLARMYGSYDLKDSCLQLRLAYSDFDDITEAELQHFENHVLAKTDILRRWRSKTCEDDEVLKVLGDIIDMFLVHVNKAINDDDALRRMFVDIAEKSPNGRIGLITRRFERHHS